MTGFQYATIVFALCCLVAASIISRNKPPIPKSKVKDLNFNILFHTDAHPIGEHGTLYVDCPARNWKGNPISFVFVGLPTSPQMSLELMTAIWEAAQTAGYTPLALRTYAQIHAMSRPARAEFAPQNQLEANIAARNIARTQEMRNEKVAQRDQQIYAASMPLQKST